VLDAIVIGLGVMGSAALHRMALAGLSVRGVERFDAPNAMGSSHGGSRVTRKAYFESPRYVPMLVRSWDLFRAMERDSKDTLLVKTGGLYFGAHDAPGVTASIEAARAHALPHEVLDAGEIRRRFPMFAPAEGDRGVFEEDAGVLFPERVVHAQLALAMEAGADVRARERVTAVELGEGGVRVTTDRGTHEADRLVLATGAWMAAPLPGVPAVPVPMVVERQVQLWLAPRTPALFSADRLPVFLRFGAETFYGLPQLGMPGVKICQHHGGAHTTAEALDRTPTADDEAPVRAFVRQFVPEADGALVGARVCMYTSTPDEHFVVGVHPSSPRVLVMGGFSGHGFKLAPVIGEMIAELATRGRTSLDASLFDPSRFV
jgi:sarcosine oxidase